MAKENHQSVMLEEVLEYLDPQKGDLVVDATFGFGGHSKAILEKIGKSGKIIAFEQDKDIFEKSVKEIDKRIDLVNENFSSLASILKKRKIKKVNKILFDLGISSYHYDQLGAGFSFKDAKLDMRLDREKGDSAADLVNYMKEEDLANLLYKNADEYFSRRIARAIVDYRKHKKIESAAELSEVVAKAVKKRAKINPATKTFQALRIAVNDELNVLEKVLPIAVNLLEENGRIVVISFHSLEDRIVKLAFKKFDEEEIIKILTKKPVVAKFTEKKQNPRSRSAKLRAAVKI